MWHRLTRPIDQLHIVRQGRRSAYGMGEEERAQHYLSDLGYHHFFNRIVPHPTDPKKRLEMDAILYAEGSVFCIEIKSYKGRIYLDPNDSSTLIQERTSRDGTQTESKSLGNPMGKMKSNIRQFQNYLSTLDRRFQNLGMTPVVLFTRENDLIISAVQAQEDGWLFMSDLPDFIARNKRSTTFSQWIVDGLEQLPTWDWILTREQDRIHGILADDDFRCRTVDGTLYRVPFSEIQHIQISRRGFLSSYDDVVIERMDGLVDRLGCSSGYVVLDAFGKHQLHRLININEITVGTQRLRSAS